MVLLRNMPFLLLIVVLSIGCHSKQTNSSVPPSSKLFAELWDIFDQHYAFFDLRKVDWEKVKKENLPLVHEIKDDSALFEHFCGLLRQFEDAHINLESHHLGLSCNAGKIPPFLQEFPSNEAFGVFIEARDKTLSQLGIHGLKDSNSKIFQYGTNSDRTYAYLRIRRFYGESLENIQSELKGLMEEIGKAKEMIIDIRVNPGGNDPTALICASPFFPKKEIAFIKQLRNGPKHEDFGKADTSYVFPHSAIKTHYQHIYLLTHRASSSSAEAFAISMKNLSNLTQIGTNTEGIFSDVYRDTLSNGWTLTLSDERYFSKDMICLEGVGVPVDVERHNTYKDAVLGVDPLIQYIVDLE